MSDIKAGSRGPRGPRGPEGHRGDRGRKGDDGDDGDTGATGPTGPTGASDAQGLAAYGHAVGINSDTFNANVDVRFDQGGLIFPNIGITVPTPGGTAFTILSTGDYEYDFYVAAHNPQNPGTTALTFAIFLNGGSAGAAHEFRSNQQLAGATGDTMVVRGQGIIRLVAGTIVTLRNRSGAGTVKVEVDAAAPGGEQGANRTLSLKKLSG